MTWFKLIEGNQEVNGQEVSLFYPNMTWSPDGHWFAFVGTDNRPVFYSFQDIFVARADGSEIHRLTYSPQYNKHYLSWSPDGKYILVAMGKNGSSDLYLVDAVNGEIVKRLTTSGGSYVATWSPDGKRIAFEGYSGLFMMNIADEAIQRINVPTSGSLQDLSWSPIGELIAFTANVGDSNCNDVFVVSINTGGAINLTSSNYYENSPVWLPDGKHLAFSRSTYACDSPAGEGYWDIYTTNIMREEQKVVSDIGYWTSIAWAPVPSLGIGKQYTITELGANLKFENRTFTEWQDTRKTSCWRSNNSS